MTYDAVVIGAGPAGSCAALALARQGRRVAIVEKVDFPPRKVCGEFISATNIALLDKLGVGNTWREKAGPEIRRVGLFAGEHCVAAAMPPASGSGYGRALGRDTLDDLLLTSAHDAGATVFQPFRATDIVAGENASIVRIASRHRELKLRAPVVVAAHGSWEPGSLPSHLPKRNHPYDLLGFKAHFRHSALPHDLMPLLVFPGGYGGMVMADQSRLSLSCCIRRDRLAEIRQAQGGSAAEAVHRHIVTSCKGVREAIGHASLDRQWLAAGPIRPGIRPRFADGVFRAGNCAGESHPIIAEGISMALQSGWLLAAALAGVDIHDRSAREAAAKLYSAAWLRQFSTRIHAAAAFAATALNPAGAQAVGPLVALLPAILPLGAALSGKTRTLPGLRHGNQR
ncbi:NAD(P)/FAD-dependent oxidoreductase [Allomesorhizobium alhagi]|uniref:FAD-dependent pyridine nucleotide-disulfide oxidoreductase n=1 Tax=Mesorhizobium alhagi CCNWXJ12-2 TaxID=1107882 RepID=H0HMY0_9HYPH|nr:NAD(P)/FAD-dependent oxidoreductase [Mesorhizobium alhagi]EHK57892.1 FAD-dependent pyridine nucleotide-disulfide oxidoreductase [Mesorhizobium alhagi CCNWXJ12-2]